MLFRNVKLRSAGRSEDLKNFIHPEKSVELYELLLVTKGTVHICEDYNRYSVSEGDLILLDKNKSYYGYLESQEPVSLYWIYFDGDYTADFDIKLVRSGADHGKMTELFDSLISLYWSFDQPEQATEYTASLLFTELYRLFLEKQSPELSPPLHDICQWIYENCKFSIKATDVAKQFCYNEDYLTRLFKNYYYMGVKNFIDCAKVKYIKSLLQNKDIPLKDIPQMCGFVNYRSFLMFFNYHEGITPTQYRKMCFIS